MAVVRINVTPEIKTKFTIKFAQQDKIKGQKEFAAHIVSLGLAKLDASKNPPGEEPRGMPGADGGNRSIEFDRVKNKELIGKLGKFKTTYVYRDQSIANRACLYAGLNIDLQDWN